MTTIALRKYLVSKINLLEDDLILEKIKKSLKKKKKFMNFLMNKLRA